MLRIRDQHDLLRGEEQKLGYSSSGLKTYPLQVGPSYRIDSDEERLKTLSSPLRETAFCPGSWQKSM